MATDIIYENYLREMNNSSSRFYVNDGERPRQDPLFIAEAYLYISVLYNNKNSLILFLSTF